MPEKRLLYAIFLLFLHKYIMFMRKFICVLLFLLPLCVLAQGESPSVEIRGTYYTVDKEGQDEEGDVANSTQSAPVRVVFEIDLGEGTTLSEIDWVVYLNNSVLFHRSGESLEYTFKQSGTYRVELKANCSFNGETFKFPEEYEGEFFPISFSVSESKLVFPNAFSPNGDDWNEELRAKEEQSIVQFEAAVFNRWGNKLYSWSDVHKGWDGKYNGKTVKDGVYFLVVNAKGADGREFKIKKTISVVTGYNNEDRASGNGD